MVWVTLLCTLLSNKLKAQQDAQYSQYSFNGLYINPAYAGYKQDLYLNAFYRSQWTGLDGAPQTLSVAVDGAVNDNKVGLGLMLSQDRIGAQNNLSFYGNYAYRLQMGNSESNRLAFGLGLGFVQNGIDGSKLNAAQPNDNYVPAGYHSSIIPDARAGIFYSNDKLFAGFSVDNLIARLITRSYNNAIAVPIPHFYLTAGSLFTLSEDIKLKTSFLLKDDRGGPTNLDLNAYFLLGDKVWLGASYRTSVPLYNKPYLQSDLQKSNAFVGMIEVFATEKIRIGYAFDYSLARLGNYNYGTHELSIGIYLKRGRVSPDFSKCYF